MVRIELQVDKNAVYNEVAKTTSYTGAKMADDDTAYERIFTTDEDSGMLDRFWDECRVEIAQTFKRQMQAEGMNGNSYKLVLELSSLFDTALQPGMQLSLFSYFVQSITAKWFMFTSKKEVGEYAAQSKAQLEDVQRKALFKKRPSIPKYYLKK